MDQDAAEEVAAWSYPGAYAFYHFTADPDDIAELLDADSRRAGTSARACPRKGWWDSLRSSRPEGIPSSLALGCDRTAPYAASLVPSSPMCARGQPSVVV